MSQAELTPPDRATNLNNNLPRLIEDKKIKKPSFGHVTQCMLIPTNQIMDTKLGLLIK